MSDNRKYFWIQVGLIFLVTLIAYSSAFDGDFIWDDDDYVTQNPVLRSLAGLWQMWVEPTSLPQYYPLVHTTFWVEFQLWGLNPLGYHLVNVIVHASAAALLLLSLRRLAVPGALLAALVFAVHPVHVESVAWITERKNVLSGLLYLAALLMWMRWRPIDGSPGTNRRLHYGLVLLLFLGALLSKTVTCSLPAAILLLIWWKRGRIERRDVVATLPLFVIGFCMAMVTAWLERVHVAAEGAAWDYSMLERVLIAGRAVWFYLLSLVWPVGLSFNYPRWIIDTGAVWQFAFPVGLACAAGALWALRARVGRAPLVALLFFGGTLVPALGFFNVFPMRYSFVADHFQYLASLGPIVLLCAWGARSWPLPPAGKLGIGCVVVAVLGTLTWRQGHAYDGHVALWTATLEENPDSCLAHANLGKVYLDSGKLELAKPHLERALELDNDWHETHLNLGVLRANEGKVEEARSHFERVVELRPDLAPAHNNLAWALGEQNELDRALTHAEKAVELDDRYPDGQSTLAGIYCKLGRKDDALEHVAIALQLAPNRLTTVLNAAWVLEQTGRSSKALEANVAALRLNPGNGSARAGLARMLAATTVSQSAEGTLQAAFVACRPIAAELAPVLTALAAELRKSGRADAAAVVAERAQALSRRR